METNSETKIYDLVQHIKRQKRFSERTFGPEKRLKGVLDHIRKELVEVEEQPQDIFEWVDLILLSLDGCWRQGFTAEQIADALEQKLSINEARTWPDWRDMSEDIAIAHKK